MGWNSIGSNVGTKPICHGDEGAELSIFRSIYLPALSYGHELWVMTEKIRLPIQAEGKSTLHWVAWLSLKNRMRSLAIREELGVQPLLFCNERN